MIRAAAPVDHEPMVGIARRAAWWEASGEVDPETVDVELPAGAVVFELEGRIVGWAAPGHRPVVEPEAQGAGVEEALAAEVEGR